MVSGSVGRGGVTANLIPSSPPDLTSVESLSRVCLWEPSKLALHPVVSTKTLVYPAVIYTFVVVPLYMGTEHLSKSPIIRLTHSSALWYTREELGLRMAYYFGFAAIAGYDRRCSKVY